MADNEYEAMDVNLSISDLLEAMPKMMGKVTSSRVDAMRSRQNVVSVAAEIGKAFGSLANCIMILEADSKGVVLDVQVESIKVSNVPEGLDG